MITIIGTPIFLQEIIGKFLQSSLKERTGILQYKLWNETLKVETHSLYFLPFSVSNSWCYSVLSICFFSFLVSYELYKFFKGVFMLFKFHIWMKVFLKNFGFCVDNLAVK